MRVTIRLFAAARDLVGHDLLDRELPEGTTVAALKNQLASECPALASLLRHSMIAVGHEYATDSAILTDSAEVAVIPPVSGG
jgi:molybdopterin converting factor subunit 1